MFVSASHKINFTSQCFFFTVSLKEKVAGVHLANTNAANSGPRQDLRIMVRLGLNWLSTEDTRRRYANLRHVVEKRRQSILSDMQCADELAYSVNMVGWPAATMQCH